MIKLYPFQNQLVDDIYQKWDTGAQNVLGVSATGSGKTVVFSHIMANFDGVSVAIAHRHELVSQISLALARNEVRHRIIGQSNVIKLCTNLHLRELGTSYYDPNSQHAVAGVDTLIRMDVNNPWFSKVGLWVQDECHHLLRSNKWGKATQMFPNARGLGVTATPVRADGKGLGRHADGLMDAMVLAPTMREIINMGFLSDYRIFAPSSDIDLTDVAISAGGDFSPIPLSNAVKKSHIIGDIVKEYLKIAPGKLGLTFCVDIKAAKDQAAAFRQQGVPAECISSLDSDEFRFSTLRKFARGDLKQIVNVDLFGEGTDIPAVEVVSMGRPTWSFGLFFQVFGRALRKFDGKDCGLIIDHVGNIMRHGLPDAPQSWSLDRAMKTSRSADNTIVQVRVCPACTAVYERILGATCPYCEHVIEPISRSMPKLVDGDLCELDADTLRKMRKEIESIYKSPAIPYNATNVVINSVEKNHRLRKEAIIQLQWAMAWWASGKKDIPRAQREFYLKFGVDVASAQALDRNSAIELTKRIKNEQKNSSGNAQ